MLEGLFCRDALDRVTFQEVLETRKEGVAGLERVSSSESRPFPVPLDEYPDHLLSLPLVTCSRSLPVALSLGTTFTRDVVAGYIG